LINAGADPNRASRNGNTPLLLAAQRGYVEVSRLLIGAGAKLEARNQFGNTALLAAVQNAQLESVRLLLAQGADVFARNSNGETALTLAQATRNATLVHVVQEATDKGRWFPAWFY
jgi:ankyrin repeat protein